MRPACLPLLLTVCACATQETGGAPAEAPVAPSGDCAALVAAAPAFWPERIPPVLSRGAEAAPDLVAALREEPDGAGAHAAIAVLGRLGNPAARPWLEEQVRRRALHSVEAALALGRLPSPPSATVLSEVAADRLADPTLRAACAAALVELGSGKEVLSLLRALVLAGTPAGAGPAAEVGLPEKPRWAHERYLVLRALRRVAPDEDFGLDTDSPWPDLERSAEAITDWLASR